MGIVDKLKGRAKQTTGDVTGSAATRREGVEEERAAEAKEEAAQAQEHAERKLGEAAEVAPEAERGDPSREPRQ